MIFIMCDDLGYGDTGFNGNNTIKTPCLDELSTEGVVFTRFFATPACSPTRGTCLTGRHYYRYGITTANKGRLPFEEITIAEVLKDKGYVTGHFGKWHLGTLTKDIEDGRRGSKTRPELYSPPWEHGFDVCFSTELAVPLWNPMENQPFTTKYWMEEGVYEKENLDGDDSRVIVDRVVPFIKKAVLDNRPFLAVVWFHAPHAPVIAGEEYRKIYSEYSENQQHYYGCITAMDEQIGRINNLVKEMGIEDNTMILFNSDNGPAGRDGINDGRDCGSTGGLRGRKMSLFNGGVNVPALLKWPKYIKPWTITDFPVSTMDFLPTVVGEVNYEMPDKRPIDGISLIPYFNGDVSKRSKPIPFRYVKPKQDMFASPTFALVDNDYKMLTNFNEEEDENLVFNDVDDRFEESNIINEKKDFFDKGKNYLKKLASEFERSHYGEDYNNKNYKWVDEYISNEQTWIDS